MKRTWRCLEVVEAAEIIENLAGHRVGGERVDGEVAPRRVLLQSSVKATVARRPSVETSRRKRRDLDTAGRR